MVDLAPVGAAAADAPAFRYTGQLGCTIADDEWLLLQLLPVSCAGSKSPTGRRRRPGKVKQLSIKSLSDANRVTMTRRDPERQSRAARWSVEKATRPAQPFSVDSQLFV